jgi:cytochrome c-type biogenesis protein CcmH
MLITILVCAIMVLLALWFVLPPLLQTNQESQADESREANILVYRDQNRELESDLKNGLIGEEQYKLDKRELERRLLEDTSGASESSSEKVNAKGSRTVAYLVGTAIPVAAIAFYFGVGNFKALTGQAASAPAPPFAGQQGQMTQQQIEANVAKLAQRLESNPNDPQGWVMLGRSYSNMNRFSDAASAYEHATKLLNTNADLWADYGEALALTNGQQLAGKPLEAVNRALQLDPKNEKALALAGSAAFEVNDYKKAIDYWQKLLPLLPPGSELAQSVKDEISRAKQLAAGNAPR